MMMVTRVMVVTTTYQVNAILVLEKHNRQHTHTFHTHSAGG